MKKEVFLAISIGFVLGLIITFGIWIANKSLKDLPGSTSPTPTSASTSAPTAAVTGKDTSPTPNPVSATANLTLNSPEDELLTDKNTVTVSGTTKPNIPVVIIFELGESVITSDGKGGFKTDIQLEGGYNLITVTIIKPDGSQVTESRQVTYSTQKI